MMKQMRATALAAGVVTVALTLVGCAPPAATTGTDTSTADPAALGVYASAQEVEDAYDITKLCGTKPLTIAFAESVTVSYFKTVIALMEREAAKCSNVTIVTTDALGDPQKANSDINSLVAQDVDGIVTLPLFGPGQIPALKAAVGAGVPVVTILSDIGAKVPTEVTSAVVIDPPSESAIWADFLDRALDGKGTIAFLGTAAGSALSQSRIAGLEEALKAYPGITFATKDIIATNVDKATTRSVMAGLLATYGRIDAIATEDGENGAAILDAYKAAGFDPPTIVTAAGSNGFQCDRLDYPDAPYLSTDGNQSNVYVGLRQLLSAINGIAYSEPTRLSPFVAADTTSGIKPKCDPSVSPDVDWSADLTPKELTEVFG